MKNTPERTEVVQRVLTEISGLRGNHRKTRAGQEPGLSIASRNALCLLKASTDEQLKSIFKDIMRIDSDFYRAMALIDFINEMEGSIPELL